MAETQKSKSNFFLMLCLPHCLHFFAGVMQGQKVENNKIDLHYDAVQWIFVSRLHNGCLYGSYYESEQSGKYARKASVEL